MMKIKYYQLLLSIFINFLLILFLSVTPGGEYNIIGPPPIFLKMYNRNASKLTHEERTRKLGAQRSRVSSVPSRDFTHQTDETDASALAPPTQASNIKSGKLDDLPRFVLRCSALERDPSSRDARDHCLESLGRSVRDPSTPIYSIAIPPDKMKAYTEAYERQQELVGGPMPKVFAPTKGPGSNFGFGTMVADPER